MRAVNIAQLKNSLSEYVRQVRAGEELLIRDRNLPVAKLVPLSPSDADAQELELAAEGTLSLPAEPVDWKTFWAIGGRERVSPKAARAIRKAVSQDRQDRDDRILGH